MTIKTIETRCIISVKKKKKGIHGAVFLTVISQYFTKKKGFVSL